ncbi:DUF4190 domain-containing protein [Streptomyces pluripotens]|uniref:DUF4190 domain-containing protein n=1 Tax=Streptomyces pluripotens TaxID=1355015 RepID=UPI001F2B9ED5|nr:DUF4190 domain-containing protein [Streptomyces pluripotens]
MSIPPLPSPGQPAGPYEPPRPYPQAPSAQGPYEASPYSQQQGGPSGVPPYQPWAQGYSPYNRPAPVNGLAIASLVLGVLCFLPGVGLLLGLVALRQIRRRGERGTGLAVGGMILSGIGLVLWVLLFTMGSPSGLWQRVKDGARGSVSTSLTKGECFDAPGGVLSGRPRDFDKVSCSGEHDGEVFASFRLDDGRYPGQHSVTNTADKRCWSLQGDYAMDSWAVPEGVDVYYLTPTEESWTAGDREVTCVFGNTDASANLTGSLRNDESVLDADQVAYLKAAHVLNSALDTAPDTAHTEGDLAKREAWAGRVSVALERQARMLRAHDWPDDAGKPVAVLTARLDKARVEWAKAARAKDMDAFYQHCDAGANLIDPLQTVTARQALGLATTPPSGDAGPAGSGGDGDTGLQV